MRFRRFIGIALGAVLATSVAACSGGSSGDVTSTVSASSSSNATSDTSVTASAVGTSGTSSTAASSPSSDSGSTPAATSTTTSTELPPVAVVTGSPAIDSTDISPSQGLTVSVDKGKITDLALNRADGSAVSGSLNADGTVWTLGEVLGYGKTYTLVGHAVGTDNKTVPIEGSYTTVEPADTVRTTVSPGDNEVVGVAAPVWVVFGVEPADRAAVEKAVSITTTPAVEGAWAWIQHDDGLWGLDYRPKNYWPSGTQVHVEAKVYGVDFGNGYWGREDVTSDFTIGRNQVVVADVNSHELVIKQDGNTVATYPASYGRGADDGDANLVTRSGTHVVMEKFETKLMSNPNYGYSNLPEKWAVRISDNGEFIHANPNSVDAQGNTNVTHGCVNLSLDDAKAYYDSVLFGDPVEVSGTDVALGPEDGDIYDWAIPWEEWTGLSGKNS